MMMNKVLGVLLGLACSFALGAMPLSTKSDISILTCGAGDEIYSLFGHSAIRVCDPEQRLDLVFNYGMFSFDSNHFIFRFIKGETDYQLGLQRFSDFMEEYREDKRYVVEQKLNLTVQEKQTLFDALQLNYQPENRVYRYNFFYDNCSSRIKNMLVSTFGNIIQFTPEPKLDNTSHFSMLAPYLANSPWTCMGIQIILGAPIYEQIKSNEVDFLPEYLMNDIDRSIYIEGGRTLPLCKSKVYLLGKSVSKSAHFWSSPTFILSFLLLLLLMVFYFEYKKKKTFVWIDQTLFIFTGLVGVFISWFMVVSVHPAVFPNYDILWLCPLNLVFGIALFFKYFKQKAKLYYAFCTLLSIVFFVICCTQNAGINIILISSILYIRAWGGLIKIL